MILPAIGFNPEALTQGVAADDFLTQAADSCCPRAKR
jgi:hypothetical protein